MKYLNFLLTPAVAASALLALTLLWALSYTQATSAAKHAALSLKPWTELTHSQIKDVVACENMAQAKAKEAPNLDDNQRLAMANRAAYVCAAPYLASQERISSAVAAQVLGHAASAAMMESARGVYQQAFPGIENLYARSAVEAHSATLIAKEADKTLEDACAGFVSSLACDAGGLTPDRPERRLSDSMLEFELDVHSQFYTATHAAEEISSKANEDEGRMGHAIAYARSAVEKNSKAQ